MPTDPALSRRAVLKLSAAGAAAAMTAPPLARAQSPRRGGVLTVRVWDPPHFDPYLIVAFKTQIVYSFTHSRLLKHKAGPGVQPGHFVLEGDLAESWSQPDDTTYVFRLRKGVRWHPKPPVNGRELTADDIVYSLERFRSVKGNPQSYLLGAVDRVEAVDRYTVKVTLTEPYAWFPDIVANPMTGAIVARECVETFGDLKKWEATVGTGPWMLDSYRPNTGLTLSRHPHYFVSGLPYADRVELVVDEDTASRTAAFLGGKYEIGPEFMGVINRSTSLKGGRSHRMVIPMRTLEGNSTVLSPGRCRSRDPLSWLQSRVRRAVSMALNRRDLVEAVADGSGVLNPPGLPAALREWALTLDQLGEGAAAYKYEPAEARRLLRDAGHPRGFQTVVEFHSFGDTTLVDGVQLVIKYLKDIGIDTRLNQKEYGAYVSSSVLGKYEGMIYGPSTPFLEPDSYLATAYLPESPRNILKVNDPPLTDLILRQRRVRDVAKRREIIHDIERHLGKQVYRAEAYSISALGVWDPALKNYGPNLGYDYGGRLVAAWLDR